jgi:cytochrome c-type biogenesis protein
MKATAAPRLLSVGKYGKQLFGFVMLVLGILIATGVDKFVEAWALNRTPYWLTAVTTNFGF